MADKEMIDFFAGVQGIVEATDFEQHALWILNQDRETPLPWRDFHSSRLFTIGHLGGRPVCISVQKSRIDGMIVLFYNATSQIVDYPQIRSWLETNAPETARKINGYVNHVDAMNFHNVFRR